MSARLAHSTPSLGDRDPEIVHTAPDKRRPGTGIPRERKGGRAAGEPRPPAVWSMQTGPMFEPPALWGQYPRGFLRVALQAIRCRPERVLHLCSGSLSRRTGGLRVDIRLAARPDVVADGARLPFRAGAFDGVLIDPPYSVEYAQDLYGTDYPRPSHLLAEAARVVTGGGRIGIVHFIVPMPVAGLRFERTHMVSQGCGYRVRAFTVFVKPPLPVL